MAYKKSNPNGQAAMAASEPVVIASDQSAVPVSGTVTANIGTVATLATAAKQDTGNTSVASIDTKTPALGQALAAASVPVILPSATVTTLTPPAAITNFANETGGNLAAIKAKTDNIPAQGQALAAASLPVVLTAAQVTTLTPPAAISGFATSAKQDTLLTELQLKADLTETQPVSLATVPSHAVTNAGTFAVQESGTQVQVDDAAFTPATSKVAMAGFEADESSTDSVDEGDGGAARMTLDRKQIVTLQPHTTGGLSTAMFSGSDGSSILVATAQVVKASAGQLYGYYAYNPEAAVTFVHFYNTAAASVTVGTTSPLFTIAIPAGSAANLTIPQGITFSNAGWAVAATTTAGGNTAPATGVSLVVWYK